MEIEKIQKISKIEMMNVKEEEDKCRGGGGRQDKLCDEEGDNN